MITRAQIRRQLRKNGGIMNTVPRQGYGLGSWVKERVRKLIPNELADIASKAAPFVAPFYPGAAAANAALPTSLLTIPLTLSAADPKKSPRPPTISPRPYPCLGRLVIPPLRNCLRICDRVIAIIMFLVILKRQGFHLSLYTYLFSTSKARLCYFSWLNF